MINFNRRGNYLCLDFKIPSLFIQKKSSYINMYSITYLRPNGQTITQIRDNLPRVIEFNSYERHYYKEYINCYNGLGWKIIDIKIVECKYRS